MSASYDISNLFQVTTHAHATNGFKDNGWYAATVIDKNPKTSCLEVYEMLTSSYPDRQPFPLKTVYKTCEPMVKKNELVRIASLINK